MKKILSAVFMAIILLVFCVGCGEKGSSDTPNAPSIVGTWSVSANYNAWSRLVFYDSGSVVGYGDDGQVYSTGSYTVSGTSFTMRVYVPGDNGASLMRTFTGWFGESSLSFHVDVDDLDIILTYIRL